MITPALKTSRCQAQFLDVDGRRLFVLDVRPTGPVRGNLLYLPPFNEEMNRCRAPVVATARALAAHGWRTLLLDPTGTGESQGDITDAHWGIWLKDAVGAARWLVATSVGESNRITVWGLRTGALLAAEVAAAWPEGIQRLLFWQPVLDGSLFLTQQLRLRIASQMVHAREKESTEMLKQRLAAGEAIEVAGYPLTGMMADALNMLRLSNFSLARHPLTWIEVAGTERSLSPVSQKFLAAHSAAGGTAVAEAVSGSMPWQVHGREDALELRETTVRLLTQAAS